MVVGRIPVVRELLPAGDVADVVRVVWGLCARGVRTARSRVRAEAALHDHRAGAVVVLTKALLREVGVVVGSKPGSDAAAPMPMVTAATTGRRMVVPPPAMAA